MWVRHRARRRGRGQVLGAPCDAFGHDCVASQTRDTNIFNLCNCVFGDTCVRFDLRRSRSPCARCAHTHHSARGGRCCGGRRRARGNEHARAAGDGSRRARGAGRTSQEIDRARSRVRPHRRRRAHRTVRAAARACVRVDRRSDRTALFPSSTKKGSRAGGGEGGGSVAWLAVASRVGLPPLSSIRGAVCKDSHSTGRRGTDFHPRRVREWGARHPARAPRAHFSDLSAK